MVGAVGSGGRGDGEGSALASVLTWPSSTARSSSDISLAASSRTRRAHAATSRVGGALSAGRAVAGPGFLLRRRAAIDTFSSFSFGCPAAARRSALAYSAGGLVQVVVLLVCHCSLKKSPHGRPGKRTRGGGTRSSERCRVGRWSVHSACRADAGSTRVPGRGYMRG